ncbi:hypothetical protein QFC24_006417 [Naganishia onofrii]|uniref:Uncharacterized protein n=1 Tax=Naganishia onofrii TaxID=1851511 RepID=A0ACC2X1R2_9TREE|nr:hypothetical protein QFC24_006417 [Naganishia onofrii]
MFSKIASATLSALVFSSFFASAAPTAQLTKQEVTIVSNCVNKGQVALTLDDGLYQYELDIVKHLGDSKATFFINGNSKSDRFGDDESVLIRDGPSTDFGCIYDRADELRVYNDLLLSALTARGYKKLFLWSDDTQDGNLVPVEQSKGVYDLVAASYPAPHIILGHSVYNSTANDVVPYGVSELIKKGYQLVAVDTCMGTEGEWPYEWVAQPQNGTWQC